MRMFSLFVGLSVVVAGAFSSAHAQSVAPCECGCPVNQHSMPGKRTFKIDYERECGSCENPIVTDKFVAEEYTDKACAANCRHEQFATFGVEGEECPDVTPPLAPTSSTSTGGFVAELFNVGPDEEDFYWILTFKADHWFNRIVGGQVYPNGDVYLVDSTGTYTFNEAATGTIECSGLSTTVQIQYTEPDDDPCSRERYTISMTLDRISNCSSLNPLAEFGGCEEADPEPDPEEEIGLDPIIGIPPVEPNPWPDFVIGGILPPDFPEDDEEEGGGV